MTRALSTASGKGSPPRVIHVQAQPCPNHPAGGDHELRLHTEDDLPVSRCRWCEVRWRDLDAYYRERTTRPATPPRRGPKP